MKAMFVLMMVLCCASGAFALTYNMTSDWTAYPNPHPTNWDFGSKIETGFSTGVFGAFEPSPRENATWWLDRYLRPDTYDSCWVGMSAIDIWIPLNKITGCPWVVSSAVAHFTGAQAGLYDLSATFNGLPTGGTGTKICYVQVNGSTVWMEQFAGLATASTPWDQPQVYLTPTDYVDFIVTDTGTSACATQMDGTLTLVPEPATMILLGLGALALRRRK